MTPGSAAPRVGIVFRPQLLPPERLPGFAAAAEAGGYGDLWLWEDCFCEGGLTTAATALAGTSSVRVGLGLMPAPLRNPALAAMEIATLARLHPGRFVPAVGHGVLSWMAQVGARAASPMTLLREWVGAVRALLHGETVSVTGDYVNLDKVALDWPLSRSRRCWWAPAGRKRWPWPVSWPTAWYWTRASRRTASAGPSPPQTPRGHTRSRYVMCALPGRGPAAGRAAGHRRTGRGHRRAAGGPRRVRLACRRGRDHRDVPRRRGDQRGPAAHRRRPGRGRHPGAGRRSDRTAHQMTMTGAEALIGTLTGAGVDVCFTNPGTSEMHFVQAMDRVPAMRAVLAVFEGVATGAADGYARITGRPAAVLLHLGPGLANGLANLHNARRAGSPLLCLVGAHATGHVGMTPRSSPTSRRRRGPCPAGCTPAARPAAWPVTRPGPSPPPPATAARSRPWSSRPTCPGRPAVSPPPVPGPAAAAASPARSMRPPRHWPPGAHAVPRPERTDRARAPRRQPDRGRDRRPSARRDVPGPDGRRRRAPTAARLPYLPEAADQALAGTGQLILAGARAPVTFFGYPGRGGDLVPDGAVVPSW